jgi:predicted dehydrogenase
MGASDERAALRVAVCGAGMRSRRVWQRHLATRAGFELVGVMDPAQAALEASVAEGHVHAAGCFTELDAMLDVARPDALLACPVIEAHGAAVRAGLQAGCHVLVEKPFVTSVDEARELVELGEARERVLAVVQNWRTRSAGRALKRSVDGGLIGDVSHVVFRYLRDREKPHLPDYLFEEADPVLWAMGIHHLDLFRYVLGQEIVHVEGRAARPAWSRYREPSINDLVLETDGGVLISYVASFSSRNAHIPQESLQVEGELGTIFNDSDYFEPPLLCSLRGADAVVDLTADVAEEQRGYQQQYDLADVAVLEDFRAAILDGAAPIASGRDNLGTLELVAACRDALRVSRVG